MAQPTESDGFITTELQPGSLGQIPGPVTWTNFICRSKHPLAAFFHIAFKVRRLIHTYSFVIAAALCLHCYCCPVCN